MNKNEDIAWVTRCALFDDRRAFACLVDKYQVRLKRFFLNLTGGDLVLSDDLAQETFIKVYYNLRWSNLLSVWTGISIYRELCLFYAPRSERR